MKKTKQQTSSALVALGLPAALLCMYAAYSVLNPSEAVAQIERLEEEVQRLTDSQVPVDQRILAENQLEKKQQELSEEQAKLDERRRLAAVLMRGEVDGMEEIKVGGAVSRVLSSAGLRLVDEHPISDSRRASSMLRSLNNATEELGGILEELAADEADDTPIEVPFDFTGEMTPTEWIAQQRALRAGNFDGPKTRLSEWKLVGNYLSMVAGLEAVIDTCPGVVVSSVAFQKPAIRTSGPTPLIWNVQLQMRPMPQDTTASSVDAMAARAGGYFRGVRKTPSVGPEPNEPPRSRAEKADVRQVYTMAKPAIAEPN
ncbi:MAG: hypothetical protein AAF989_08415 [Planctomycetota bacterium]